jgi:hypothetical protein
MLHLSQPLHLLDHVLLHVLASSRQRAVNIKQAKHSFRHSATHERTEQGRAAPA